MVSMPCARTPGRPTDAATWLALATGELRWDEAVAQSRVSASGSRADLTAFLSVRLGV
ncbi:hypothetical protein IAE22_29665 [Bacillus sp. S34]|nr:hypothetical protein [Bacillus sp. S34]